MFEIRVDLLLETPLEMPTKPKGTEKEIQEQRSLKQP